MVCQLLHYRITLNLEIMQVIKIQSKWLGLFCIFLQGCVYEYSPKLDKYENLLTVYGIVTNDTGPYEVLLSRTTSVYNNIEIPEHNATVSISDNKGNSVYLFEKEEGKYITPDDYFGIIGNSYKLSITLSTGKHYESTLVQLIEVPEINQVEYELTTKNDAKTGEELQGYQFYVDVNNNTTKQKYLRWEMDEIWEIYMPFPEINTYFDGRNMTEKYYPSICWHYTKIDEIFVVNTEDYQSNSLKKLPINFTSANSSRLSVRYSLTVKQYALSENSYSFWKGQAENTQQQGTLYNKQPYQVIGNIKSIENPDEVVLGIFEASAVSSKQVFANRPPIPIRSDYDFCIKKDLGALTREERRRPYWAYIFIMGSYAVLNENCVDCTLSGGTPIKPNNWDN